MCAMSGVTKTKLDWLLAWELACEPAPCCLMLCMPRSLTLDPGPVMPGPIPDIELLAGMLDGSEL